MNIVGIIVAAGNGSRTGTKSKSNKVFLKFGGSSALARCIKAHRDTELFSKIILVCRNEDYEHVNLVAVKHMGGMPWEIVIGGKERQDSVANALSTIGEDADYVSIHDAARCFVTDGMISKCIKCALQYGSAVPASPVIDTVKQIDGNRVVKTLNRKELVMVQTPQVFSFKTIIDAYERAYTDGYYGTDDASLVERIGKPVYIVSGCPENIKITTKADIEKGMAIAENDSSGFRIGNGFDVHAFKPGRTLVLGGVEIEGVDGLDGHSDADVLLHALMDALLGAAGLPDIGELFPPGAAQYKDISSLVLLKKVKDRLDERFCRIINIDITLMMQTPKIAKYKQNMISNIAKVLGISTDVINIKGTTTEHLGFIGRKEGVCASAVCLLKV